MKTENKNNKVSLWLTRSILFVLTIALLVYFFPKQGDIRYVFQEGRPWAYSLLTAPFDIPIYKDEATLNQERDSILKDLRPIFIKNDKVADEMVADFTTELNGMGESALSAEGKIAFINALQELYDNGIISSEQYKGLNDYNVKSISMRENNTLKPRNTEEFYSPKKAYEVVMDKFSDSYQRHLLQVCNFNKYIVANVQYDSITTNKVRDDLLQKVTLSDGVVQAGERIVDRGEIITPEIYRILTSYEIVVAKHFSKDTSHKHTTMAGQIVVFGCILAFLYFFLAFFRRRMWSDNKALILIMLLTTLLSIAAFVIT
ncbi:MAG: hydrolase, partial [Bacteroidales bacterium]|nr:hydrolase [Bacteroidales bacterium]